MGIAAFCGKRCVAFVVAGLFVCGMAVGQEKKSDAKDSKGKPPAKRAEDPGAELLNKAYAQTGNAKTIDDLSEIIELCEKGLEATQAKQYIAYGKRLAAWAHFKRGELYAQGEKPDEKQALADFDAAVKLRQESDPDSPEWGYLHQRGVSLAMAGRHEDALKDFNRVLELRPNFGKQYFLRGELYSALGDFRKAIEDYNQATRYAFNESKVYTSRGFAFFTFGDVRQAMNDYNLAISRNDQDYDAYTFRGDAFTAQGNHAAAVRDYQRAITLNDRHARAYFSAAWLRATCADANYRDAQSALRNAKLAIQHGGETFRNLDALAAAQARAGQFEEAVATQEKAISAAPKEELEALKKRLALYEKKEAYVSEERSDSTSKKPR
jgi:tetratricopeptide (TPR) repeat protein